MTLKKRLYEQLEKVDPDDIAVSTILADIAYLIQDSRIKPTPMPSEIDKEYGGVVMDVLESDKIREVSLGSAFFVISKCYDPNSYERFLRYISERFDSIKDIHSIGNAYTAIENHRGLVSDKTKSHQYLKRLLKKIKSSPATSPWKLLCNK